MQDDGPFSVNYNGNTGIYLDADSNYQVGSNTLQVFGRAVCEYLGEPCSHLASAKYHLGRCVTLHKADAAGPQATCAQASRYTSVSVARPMAGSDQVWARLFFSKVCKKVSQKHVKMFTDM